MNRHPGDRDADDPDADGSDAAGHGGAAGDSGAPVANGECADVFGCPGEAADDEALAAVAQQLRAEAVRDGAAPAAKLERVALLAWLAAVAARRRLAAGRLDEPRARALALALATTRPGPAATRTAGGSRWTSAGWTPPSDLLRRVRDGARLPGLGVRWDREIGLVLHTDTLVGDGPAAQDPGERRGLGAPAPVDPTTARETAEAEVARGAPVCVFLTDTSGVLVRLVRLMLAPAQGGWTRQSLTAAVRAALPGLPPLSTDRYVPTVAITEHVHARKPALRRLRLRPHRPPRRPGPRPALAPRPDRRVQPVPPVPAPPRTENPTPRDHPAAARRLGPHPDADRDHPHHPTRTPARSRARRGLRPVCLAEAKGVSS